MGSVSLDKWGIAVRHLSEYSRKPGKEWLAEDQVLMMVDEFEANEKAVDIYLGFIKADIPQESLAQKFVLCRLERLANV